ncbi:MAG TPA: T9SS type A sorting domain-containing protein [bacterium]
MRIVLFWMILLPVATATAQSRADSAWVQPFGATGECVAGVIRRTADQGYFFAGTEASPSGDDVRAVLTDSSGQVLWSREYCGAFPMRVRDARQTAAGDFLLAGTTAPLAADSEHAFVMRVNGAGDTVWNRVFDDTVGGFHAIQPLEDGGCVLTGWTAPPDSGGSNVALIRLNAWGNVVWKHTYDEPGEEWAVAVQKAGRGYLMVGQSRSDTNVEMLHILRTDSAGNLRWTKAYPLRGLKRIYGFEQVEGGEFVMAGLRNPPSEPCTYFLMRMDSTGVPLWLRSCHSGCDAAEQVVMKPTLSGFLMTRLNVSLGDRARQMEIWFFDQAGEFQYRTFYDGMGYRRWERPYGYWESRIASPFAAGIYDFFVDPHAPVAETASIVPQAPFPERSERHHPLDSFGNVYWASFTLNRRQWASITVYDTTGRLIRTVADEEYGSGSHTEIFDGWALPPGIYFLRVKTEELQEVKKVVLVR